MTDIDTLGTTSASADGAEAPAASEQAGRTRRRGSGLSGMLLPELQRLAADLGIAGTARMRKGDLVAAITARQVGGDTGTNGSSAPAPRSEDRPEGDDAARGVAATAAPLEAPISGGANGGPLTQDTPGRARRGASRPAGSPTAEAGPQPAAASVPTET